MFRIHPASTIAVLLALLMSSVPSTATHVPDQHVRVCGLVHNTVGWAIEGIEVRAFVTSVSDAGDNQRHLSSDDDPGLRATSGPDGRFQLVLPQSLSYRVLLHDPLGPTNVSRGGAVYQPATANLQSDPASVRPDVCPGGQSGIPIGSNDGRVVISSPNQGFIEARVHDGALTGNPAKGDVDVFITPTLHGSDLDPNQNSQRPWFYSFHTHTRADGVARLACQSVTNAFAPTRTDATLLFQRIQHLDANRSVPCVADQATYVSILLWRKPVTVSVRVVNETGQDDALTGGASPEAAQGAPGTGVEGAKVEVVTTPAPLRSLASGSAACGTTGPVAISVDNATPYVCEGVTGKGGVVQLRLPWADSAYALRASVDGYAAKDFALAVPAAVSDPRAGGTGLVETTVTLARPSQDLTGKVTDVRGAGIPGVAVTFSNDADDHVATTGADGAFNLTLPTGPFDVTLVKDGYNNRSCFVQVVPGTGTVATIGEQSPFHCWSLAATGKSVVGGKFRDIVTQLPIPGLQLCLVGTTECSSTRADGTVFLEVAPGSDVTVTAAPGQGWTFQQILTFANEAERKLDAADSFRGFSPLLRDLERETTAVTLLFTDGTNGLATTLANLTGPAAGGQIFKDRAADASGQIVEALPWSRHATLTQFNLGDYVVEADRHKASRHYSLAASRNFHVAQGAAPFTVTITMTEDGAVDTALLLYDAHTLQPITTIGKVKAETTAPAAYACGPVCIADVGAATGLRLYAGHSYRLCGEVPGYSTVQAEACKAGIPPGRATTIHLNRTRVTLNVKVVDPHTNLNVNGIQARAVVPSGSTFRCTPTDITGYCVSTSLTSTTGTGGVVTFTVPWHDPTQLCIELTSGTGQVMVNAGPHMAHQEFVHFQPAKACPNIPSTATSHNMDLLPLRAPIHLIEGKVENATTGGTIEDAKVVPGAERGARANQTQPTFICNPVAHNTTGGSFPDCGGALVNPATGAFRLVLPGGDLVSASNPNNGARLAAVNTPAHMWNLTATRAGSYDTLLERVANNTKDATLTLWPRAFTATVTVAAMDRPCVAANVQVTLTQYDRTSDPELDTRSHRSTGAVQNPDGTCAVQVPVSDWHHDVDQTVRLTDTVQRLDDELPADLPDPPQTPPQKINARRPVTGGLFVLSASESDRVGLNATLLSPRASKARVELAEGSLNPATPWPNLIVGNVTDADAATRANGNDVPPALRRVAGAIVTAERQGGSCPGGARAFQSVSGPTGAFAVPVACGGTYVLRVEQAAQLYQPSQPRTVTLGVTFDDVASRPQDAYMKLHVDAGEIPLSRALYTLVVKTMRVEGSTVQIKPGVSVDPEGVTVSADPAGKTSPLNATLQFYALPWGAYSLQVSSADPAYASALPTRHYAYAGPGAPEQMVFVRRV